RIYAGFDKWAQIGSKPIYFVPLPCQGWGRGFESLRPLQISQISGEALAYRPLLRSGASWCLLDDRETRLAMTESTTPRTVVPAENRSIHATSPVRARCPSEQRRQRNAREMENRDSGAAVRRVGDRGCACGGAPSLCASWRSAHVQRRQWCRRNGR